MANPTVLPLHEIPVPDPGTPSPVVVSNEDRTAVAYRSGESTAVLVFEGCAAIQFGYPNDEALEGHPLWGFGLAYHGAFEVVDSPWRSALEAQNAVAFPDTAWGEGLRHFVLTFHDTTFECLSAGVGVAWSDETPESAGSRAIW